ncbi:MAG: Mur ligase domain-containing protein [Actinomycetes bacterium]|jgi:UDP-N-acetylmuramoyl-tripeptide--D-alanyl-D-alanine ligase|nr:Mur ligase domain-containing protein [Actinomycetes bacterium]
MTAKEIAAAAGARLYIGDATVTADSCVIDSRQSRPGSLFIAFCGEHTDGHLYLQAAVDAGATVLLVTDARAELPVGVTVLLADDAERALQNLARHQRRLLDIPVVGITGSVGKTTTRQLTAAALTAAGLTVTSSRANENNELGVPLTLLSVTADTQVLVVEMGMRGSGEIALLADIARPTIGVVTTIGDGHIERLGSRDAIANAKAELLQALPADGWAILDAAGAYRARLAEHTTARVLDVLLSVGENEAEAYGGVSRAVPQMRVGYKAHRGLFEHVTPPCASASDNSVVDNEGGLSSELAASELLKATGAGVDAQGRAFGTVTFPDGYRGSVHLRLLGMHALPDALFALAVGYLLGCDPDRLLAGVAACDSEGMRMRIESLPGCDIRIVNDAYNANPDSTAAALRTLAAMETTGRRIAVLGDMLELGSMARVAHRDIQRLADDLGLDRVFCYGRWYGDAYEDRDALLKDLIAYLADGDIVLFKGSRGMQMELMVDALKGQVRC